MPEEFASLFYSYLTSTEADTTQTPGELYSDWIRKTGFRPEPKEVVILLRIAEHMDAIRQTGETAKKCILAMR